MKTYVQKPKPDQSAAARGPEAPFISMTMHQHEAAAECETHDVEYTYGLPSEEAPNAKGRILRITDASGITTLSYGKLGEVEKTTKTLPLTDGTPATFITEQRYDSFGRMKKLVYPDGDELSYVYDEGGLLKSASSTLNGETTTYIQTLAYDEFGQRKFIEYGNGVTSKYIYDEETRRLSTLESFNSEGTKVQNLEYAYDKVGNVLTMNDEIDQYVRQDFEYDNVYRLNHAEGTTLRIDSQDPTKTSTHSYIRDFKYDRIHNMTEKRASYTLVDENGETKKPGKQNYTFSYEYNHAKPHAVSDIEMEFGDGNIKPMSYSYDDSGNLIDRTNTQNKHSRKVVWDDDNHMTTVIDQRDIITRFTYNADGERVRKKGPYGETIYINQFYSIRNNIVSSKHIFAGNTRIATRLTQVGERIREYYDDSTNLAEILSSDQIRIDTTGNGNSYGNQNVGGYSSMDKGKSPKGQESQPTHNGKGNAYGKYKENNGNAYGKDKEKPNQANGKEKNADKGNKENENSNREHIKVNENSNKPEDSEKERGKSAEKAQRDKEKPNDEECHGNSGKGDCEKLHGRENKQNKEPNPNKPTDKGGPENANGNAYAYGYYKKLYGSSYYDSTNSSPSSYSNFHGPTGGKSQGRGGGVFKGQESQLFYYHGDHLGSSSFTSDSAGLVHDRTLYFPFGETWIEEGGNEDKDLLGFKFTGKELDDETGYYYFGARYYEPQTARWISVDPIYPQYLPSASQVYFPDESFSLSRIKGNGGVYRSLNINLYMYVYQNPMKYVDPDGNLGKSAHVIIHAGHINKDGGGSVKNLTEAQANGRNANYVAAGLYKRGYSNVQLITAGDASVEKENIDDTSNAMGADVLISLHIDSPPGRTKPEILLCIQSVVEGENTPDLAKQKKFMKLLTKELAKEFGSTVIPYPREKLKQMDNRQGYGLVLELGNANNPETNNMLGTPVTSDVAKARQIYLDKVVDAIDRAIQELP